MNRILMTICLALASIWACAQTTTVTGTVSDSEGPLIGATVLIKGTQNAASTDFDGNFSLKNVNPAKDVLIVRYVGFDNKEVPLKGQTNVDILMEANATMMDEVVVIGYGTQKRGNLTGSMSSVEAKVIERMPVANVGEAIIGRMPGVQVTTADGSPDAEVTVRIRGGGSITQSNQPLVLIDGFEGSLNDVPATDVDNIQVLKDAASTAIYGARGANGVVLVTTKKPSEGKVQVNVNAYVQTKELSNKLDVLKPYDFVRANYDRLYSKGSSVRDSYANSFGKPFEMYIYQGYEGYDWQDIIFSTHPVSWAVDGSVSGGNEKFKFKLSFMHQDQPSVMPDNGLIQNNINGNLNVKLWNFLSIEYRTRYMNKTLQGRGTEGIGLLTALQEQPTYGLQDFAKVPENNEYLTPDEITTQYHYDPLETNERYYRNRYSKLLNMGGALNWTIIKGMTLRNEFTWEDFDEDDRAFNAAESDSNSRNWGPYLTQKKKSRTKWQLTNVWNYALNIKDTHDFQFMLGQEMKHNGEVSQEIRIAGFPENLDAEKAYDNFALGTPRYNRSTHGSPNRVSSFFGRINYSFDDRYLATFTLRADGSTKFSKKNRWGWFPAGAIAWRISNEKFLKDYTWLTNLKLRASIGFAGNDRIDSDLYMRLYKLGDTSQSAGWGEQGSYWYEFNSKFPVNPDAKWETTITRNLGLDFSFFNGRLDGTFDLYFNTTKDLLIESQIPGDTGFTEMLTNIGQTSNKGFELNLNAYIIENKDWTLGANFNIGLNKGKIDKLADGESAFYANVDKVDINDDVFWYRVGQRMGQIYGYVNDGFYKVEDFIYNKEAKTYTLKPGIVDSSPLAGTLGPGSPKFKKLTPVDPDDPESYIINADDRKIIGNTSPKFSGGFGINATWRGFDLNAFFNFMCGFDVLNLNKIHMATTPSSSGQYRNLSADFEGMWMRTDEWGNYLWDQPEVMARYNKNATMWSPNNVTKAFVSTYGVEDGSFLRLQTLTLGYSLPTKLLKHVGMTKCRFYVTGYNLFTISKYSGYDPEVNIGEGLTPNVDYNMYPRARTYTFGVQLSF